MKAFTVMHKLNLSQRQSTLHWSTELRCFKSFTGKQFLWTDRWYAEKIRHAFNGKQILWTDRWDFELKRHSSRKLRANFSVGAAGAETFHLNLIGCGEQSLCGTWKKFFVKMKFVLILLLAMLYLYASKGSQLTKGGCEPCECHGGVSYTLQLKFS